MNYPETRQLGHVLHGAGALVLLIAALSAYACAYSPIVDASNRARGEIGRIQEKANSAATIRSQHAELKARLEEAAGRIEQLRRRIPEDAHVSEFVAHVTRAADEEDITISDFEAGAPVENNGFSQREITFSCAGRFASLCRFVDRVDQLSRLTKVTGLRVHSDAAGQQNYPMTLRTRIYFGLRVDESKDDGGPSDG